VKHIVGLGNPGLAYEDTRHNVGFMVIDGLAVKCGIALSRRRFRAICGEGETGGERAILMKPQTFMNLSGLSVRDALADSGCSLRDLIVIHDDIDLPFGSIRVRQRGGHGGHRGVQSIMERMEGSDFVRVKIGVGRPGDGMDVEPYVLHPFEKDERERLGAILSTAVDAVEAVVREGVEYAMNTFNVVDICEKMDK
jgi:PTH1 family peptidyl-tRNA hydrolase